MSGLGVVSPAGWGLPAFREALQRGTPLPIQSLSRPGWERALQARVIPTPETRPACFAHARLRRVSPLTQYAAAAAMEAAGAYKSAHPAGRIGLIFCLQAGLVQYAAKFYTEVINSPGSASPLLFPETVYSAPASHIAALFENVTMATTLMGDPAGFLRGIALGAEWLTESRVDAALIVAADETNWVHADALWRFDHQAVIASGAGAVLLRAENAGPGVELRHVTDPQSYSSVRSPLTAGRAMRAQLEPIASDEMLLDGLCGAPRSDRAEAEVWRDWSGSRLSVKKVLGDGLIAGGAWQCIAACDVLATGNADSTIVSLVGNNQQALGARFQASKGQPLEPAKAAETRL